MKEKVKKHLENSLKLLKEIGNFCLEKKENDTCKALFYELIPATTKTCYNQSRF